MTGQNDRQHESLTGQVRDQAGLKSAIRPDIVRWPAVIFSPDMLPREMVMRVNKIITKEKMLWSFTKFSQLFFKEMYEGQYGEFICGYRGLKG